jgi:DinB superfamily
VESSVHTQLHRLIDMAHERQLAQIAALSDAERDESGTSERWSAKDQFAHTMYWKERLSERLTAASHGESPAEEGDVQSTNEANFKAHRNRPWADVLADDARIHAQLLANLDALSEENLVDPSRFAWKTGEPLLANVLGSLWHVQEHLAQPFLDRDDLDGASQVFEAHAREITQSSLPPVAHAYAVYNLACFHAVLTGNKARALELLAEALRLRPSLTEWSKQDPDFALLRDDPAYQALYLRGD